MATTHVLVLGLLAATLLPALALPECWSVLEGRRERFEVTSRSCRESGFRNREIGWASWDDAINSTGWAFLEIHTNPRYIDEISAEAAGFLEGAITAERIYQNAANSGALAPLPAPLNAYLKNNTVWLKQNIATAQSRPVGDQARIYWRHVNLIFQQLQGLVDGYASATFARDHPLTYEQIHYISLSGDLEDLPGAGGLPVHDAAEENGHCSAFVRLTANNQDLFISQVTWSSVNSMLRVYKLYDFPFNIDEGLGPVPAVRSAFSSYPGSLYSGDDFYLLSSGLVVQETTIGYDNPALAQYIVPTTVLEWARNMLANRLARSGQDWIFIYSQHNSGTYNNQNMILDYNLFEPGRPLRNGTFYICEQIPGTIRAHDLSNMLQTQRYFGSYNTAFDPQIRELAGANANEAKYGSWFAYETTPRALIFRRAAPTINSLDDLKRLMRYNDFKNDPFSSQLPSCQFLNMTNCTPPYSGENAIACRCDLNPADGVYAFSALGFRNHVGTDAKISSFSTFDRHTLPSWAISGPTSDQQPPFRFSTSPFANTSHLGLPDLFDFPWVNIEWRN